MINLLCMDIYRMIRGKALYLCLLFLALSIVLCYGILYLVGTPEGQKTALKLGMATLTETGEGSSILDGVDALTMFRSSSMDGGFYTVSVGILMALFVCSDYSGGFVKNIMALHKERWKYIISKMLLAGGINFFYLAVTYGLNLMMNQLFHHMVPNTDWKSVLLYMGAAWCLTTAFCALIVLVCVCTRSAAAGVLAAVFVGGGVIVTLFSSIMNLFHAGGWAGYTIYYLLSGWTAGSLKGYVFGLIYGILYAAVSAYVITKQDI